jgi:hypothetical protein
MLNLEAARILYDERQREIEANNRRRRMLERPEASTGAMSRFAAIGRRRGSPAVSRA